MLASIRIRRFFRYRTLRATREGGWFILFTLGVGFAAINTGNNLLYLLVAMMLSLIVASGILSEQSLRRISVSREPPRRIFAQTPALLRLRLKNPRKRLPSFSLWVRQPDPSGGIREGRAGTLAPRGEKSVGLEVTFPRRGRFTLGEIQLFTRFPFHFFTKRARVDLEQELLIYPKPLPPTSDLAQKWTEAGAPVQKKGEEGGFHNLRPYVFGDNARSIHWKSSARTGRLMVAEREREEERQVTILLRGGSGEAFEAAVSRAAGALIDLNSRGVSVRLLVPGESIPFGRGERHLDRCLTTLALTTGEGAAPVEDASFIDISVGS